MDIKRYTALIWRWAWLILLGTLIAGTTAYIVSKRATPIYRSSARLLIDEAPGSATGNEYSQILLEQRLTLTYIEILKTRPVLEETIRRLGLPFSAGRLEGMISAIAPQDTQIIVLSIEDTDPVRAAEIANTLGEVFIDQNQERENLRYAEPIANWQSRQDEIGDEIESLETQINNFGLAETAEEQAAYSRLETRLKESQILYTEAFNNVNELQVSQAKESSNVVQIEPAQPTTSPIRPRVFANTMIAAATGGFLAIGVIFLIEYLDDTVKTPDQVTELTGLSTLGAIAIIKNKNENDSPLVTYAMPRDPVSEAYRVLRTNLGFSAVDGGMDSLLITSSSPGEGKSTTVANLAIVMAQTGKKVTIVDADLRRPTQHKIFGLPNNLGLTTAFLDNEKPFIHHLQKTKITGLNILTSGPLPPNPAELLNSAKMSEILRTLKQESDVLIFDTPPTLTVADATILAPQVSGSILIVEVAKTRANALSQAAERLRKANANVFGTVMNLLNPSRGAYYYYYYNYYYYYSHYSNDHSRRAKRRRGKKQNRPKLPAWLSGINRR